MYLLVCGQALSQIFCKIPLKVLKGRVHLVFTVDHFLCFMSKQHLELASTNTVYFIFK